MPFLSGVLVLLAVAMPAFPWARLAAATSPATTSPAVDVDVLPEHDDPRILVIYRGTLGENVALPYALTFAIPIASQVHAVAYRRGDQLFSAAYDARLEGNRLQVAFAVPEREFQFEYYTEFTARQPERRLSIPLVFPFAVERLRIAVEQPLRATDFRVFPEGERSAAAGFTYYLVTQRGVAAGQPVTVRVVYAKPDDEPSLPRPAVPAPPPGPPGAPPGAAPPPGGVPPDTIQPPTAVPAPAAPSPYVWVAVIAVAVLLAGAVLAVPFLRRDRPPPRDRPPRRRTAAPAQRPQGPQGQEARPRRYCTNCGARARPQDRFCSQCGEPLRGG